MIPKCPAEWAHDIISPWRVLLGYSNSVAVRQTLLTIRYSIVAMQRNYRLSSHLCWKQLVSLLHEWQVNCNPRQITWAQNYYRARRRHLSFPSPSRRRSGERTEREKLAAPFLSHTRKHITLVRNLFFSPSLLSPPPTPRTFETDETRQLFHHHEDCIFFQKLWTTRGRICCSSFPNFSQGSTRASHSASPVRWIDEFSFESTCLGGAPSRGLASSLQLGTSWRGLGDSGWSSLYCGCSHYFGKYTQLPKEELRLSLKHGQWQQHLHEKKISLHSCQYLQEISCFIFFIF